MYLIGFVPGCIILKIFFHSLRRNQLFKKGVILSRFTYSYEFNDMISEKDYVTNGEIHRFLRDIRNLISFEKRTKYCVKVQIVHTQYTKKINEHVDYYFTLCRKL